MTTATRQAATVASQLARARFTTALSRGAGTDLDDRGDLPRLGPGGRVSHQGWTRGGRLSVDPVSVEHSQDLEGGDK